MERNLSLNKRQIVYSFISLMVIHPWFLNSLTHQLNSCFPRSQTCSLNRILNKLDFISHFGFLSRSKRMKNSWREKLGSHFKISSSRNEIIIIIIIIFMIIITIIIQLEFTPLTELDYGTFLCWAENSIGR